MNLLQFAFFLRIGWNRKGDTMEWTVALINTVRPFTPMVLSGMMIYLLVYLLVKPRNGVWRALGRSCKTAFSLTVAWHFLYQSIFTPVNMSRFSGSAWLPLLEALFRR